MGLFSKGKKPYSIFNMKCPRCHTGELFPTKTFSFKQPFEMHDECPHCKQDYMPEPGFYYGAMFISYIITGWFCLGFVGLLIMAFDFSITASFVWLIIVIASLFVWIFRISRSLWINVTIHYKKEAELQGPAYKEVKK